MNEFRGGDKVKVYEVFMPDGKFLKNYDLSSFKGVVRSITLNGCVEVEYYIPGIPETFKKLFHPKQCRKLVKKNSKTNNKCVINFPDSFLDIDNRLNALEEAFHKMCIDTLKNHDERLSHLSKTIENVSIFFGQNYIKKEEFYRR